LGDRGGDGLRCVASAGSLQQDNLLAYLGGHDCAGERKAAGVVIGGRELRTQSGYPPTGGCGQGMAEVAAVP